MTVVCSYCLTVTGPYTLSTLLCVCTIFRVPAVTYPVLLVLFCTKQQSVKEWTAWLSGLAWRVKSGLTRVGPEPEPGANYRLTMPVSDPHHG